MRTKEEIGNGLIKTIELLEKSDLINKEVKDSFITDLQTMFEYSNESCLNCFYYEKNQMACVSCSHSHSSNFKKKTE